ncbi:hypothetical protein BCR37DRAFT_394976 [Protomyces lactucae-debilis]|uniref:Uncharacterized protein n=1 Tax=Protomyces lactucae-debilis TaxID=2754530 RepID=A0A1Y2F0I5_PROLT|nr:uncharacterized protein BCR37DRAFT_394976 [Protomyces lactucae-debilis]ORY77359.1 hypothetical protein BCR37DRAFT_394976 [Protomyces lactucae-debilis]
MSFTFHHSIEVDATPAKAYHVFADPASFEEIMVSSSVLTRDCTLTSSPSNETKEVTFSTTCTPRELASMAQRLLEADESSKWTAQSLGALVVHAMHFKLTEEVVYLGFKKVIPVTGTMFVPRDESAPFCQFDHRKTDDGLVETRKMRVITPSTTVSTSVARAEIWEELIGTTSWYLKYFVEAEAQKSHANVVKYYETHFNNLKQDQETEGKA